MRAVFHPGGQFVKSTSASFALISVLSLAAGAWEVAVTRLGSLLFFHELTYLLVSVCLLGLGLGAALARSLPPRLLGAGIAALLSMPLVWTLLEVSNIAWAAAAPAWPFFFVGLASTWAWAGLRSDHQRRALFGLEAISAVVGLTLLGPWVITVLPMDPLAPVGIATHLKRTVADEGLVHHEGVSTPYARTDLVRTRREGVVYFFTDAMYVTRAVAWDGKAATFADPHVESLARLKRVALAAGPRDSVLILGAGAGVDVAIALQAGAGSVDAVEVNQVTIERARALGPWTGAPYDDPRVQVHVAEARRFVEASEATWDHIALALMETSPAGMRNQSHVDARVLTVEAVQAYLRRLSPLGVLAIIQNSEPLAHRTYQTVRAAGVDGAQISALRLMDPGNPFRHLLLVRKVPFNSAERGAHTADPAVYRVDVRASPEGRIATDDRPFLFESPTRVWLYGTLTAMAVAGLLGWLALRQRRAPRAAALLFVSTLIGAATFTQQMLVIAWFHAALGLPSLATGLGIATALAGAALGVGLRGVCSLRSLTGAVCLLGLAQMVLLFVGPSVAGIAQQWSLTQAGTVAVVVFGVLSLPSGLPFLALAAEAARHTDGRTALVIAGDSLGGVLAGGLGAAVAVSFGFLALGSAAIALVALTLLTATAGIGLLRTMDPE